MRPVAGPRGAPCGPALGLDKLDAQDDEQFCRKLLSLVRAGRLDRAQALCIAAGQLWRAAALDGWRLHCDPRADAGRVPGEDAPVPAAGDTVGNIYRDVWLVRVWLLYFFLLHSCPSLALSFLIVCPLTIRRRPGMSPVIPAFHRRNVPSMRPCAGISTT
jgi:hypothetical protein